MKKTLVTLTQPGGGRHHHRRLLHNIAGMRHLLNDSRLWERWPSRTWGKPTVPAATWSFLGLWMIGRPDIGEAIDEALRKRQGTALVNVRCYETYRWFVLFSHHHGERRR